MDQTLKSNPLYQTWYDMIRRCYTPHRHDYKNYGGRGIKVCDRWLNSFWAFVEDIGDKPSKKHSLDRVDVNGNYAPDNCKWSTQKEQCNNKRNNRLLEYNGLTMTLTQWAEYLGIKKKTLWQRLNTYKWPLDRCLSEKVG